MITLMDFSDSEKYSPSYYSNKDKNFVTALADRLVSIQRVVHSKNDSLYEITSNSRSIAYLNDSLSLEANSYEYDLSSEFLDSYNSNSSVNYLNSLSDTIKKNSAINKAIGRILALGMYEDGWNSSESVKPSPRTVMDAQKLARNIFSKKIVFPIISLSDDGEISFYWDRKEYILDIGVFGDGNYSYYFKDTLGNELFADDVPIEYISQDQVIGMIEIKNA